MNEIQLLQKIAKYVQLVNDMRKSQKEYFKTRSRDSLVKSKGLRVQMICFLLQMKFKIKKSS